MLELGVEKNALSQALLRAKQQDQSVFVVLNQLGHLSDDQLVEFFQIQTGLRIIELDQIEAVPTDSGFAPEFLRARRMLPICRHDDKVDIAFVDPTDIMARDAAPFVLGDRFGKCLIIRPSDWRRAYETISTQDDDDPTLDASSTSDAILEQIVDQDRDAPIARKVASLLADAVEFGASDVHVESRRNSVDIRMRIDGALKGVSQEAPSLAPAIIARIKVMSDLDLGERRMPQDGRTTIIIKGKPIDVRVSIIPTAFGESAVLRLLDRPKSLLTLEGLGFSQTHQSQLGRIMKARDGLFLVAGPTGSGKTTTLYACLQLLAHSQLKILSVEDPIEYQFDHVTQVQTNEASGLTFPKVLRSFLRHDPDVILIGEIRDVDTAKIAVQAALTGHLVLASIHAIDAERIKTRLIDMGIDPYQLDAALSTALSQRLVRQLCDACKHPLPVSHDEAVHFRRVGLDAPQQLYHPKGCSKCSGQGFKGRLVIADMLGDEDGSLLKDALSKVAAGRTCLSEILSVMGDN